MRQVGHAKQELGQGALHRLQLTLTGRDLVAEAGNVGEQSGHVLASGLGATDGLGRRIALCLQVLGAHLDLLAPALQTVEAAGVEAEAAFGEPGRDRGDVMA